MTYVSIALPTLLLTLCTGLEVPVTNCFFVNPMAPLQTLCSGVEASVHEQESRARPGRKLAKWAHGNEILHHHKRTTLEPDWTTADQGAGSGRGSGDALGVSKDTAAVKSTKNERSQLGTYPFSEL